MGWKTEVVVDVDGLAKTIKSVKITMKIKLDRLVLLNNTVRKYHCTFVEEIGSKELVAVLGVTWMRTALDEDDLHGADKIVK